MTSDPNEWKKELERDLQGLEKKYRSYEQTPTREVRDQYEKDLANLQHATWETLQEKNKDDLKRLVESHPRNREQELNKEERDQWSGARTNDDLWRIRAPQADERTKLMSGQFQDTPQFQSKVARLEELQGKRWQEVERMCREPLARYDREHGFDRDPDRRDRGL